MGRLLKIGYRLAFWLSLLLFYMVFSVELTDFLSGIDIADIDDVNDVLVIYICTALGSLCIGSLIYAFKVITDIKDQVDADIESKKHSQTE